MYSIDKKKYTAVGKGKIYQGDRGHAPEDRWVVLIWTGRDILLGIREDMLLGTGGNILL